MTYAGRLDPMASGKLLILIGDECKKRKKYDGLDKEYEFEILFGFKTDTGDVLGVAEMDEDRIPIDLKELDVIAQSLIGKKTFEYPAYSSKTVSGKPLFQYAAQANLAELELPKTEIKIYKLEFLGLRKILGRELLEGIKNKISKLDPGPKTDQIGNGFRKKEILEKWATFKNLEEQRFTIATFKIIVSSGSYIRSIAPHIASELGQYGLAYSIHRTKIGRYLKLRKNTGFWIRNFK